MPNLPGELTGDPSSCMASDQEILTPPADRDMMGTQYVRNHEARCRMQQHFAQKNMKDRILRAGRLRVRPERDYFRGQWVMLWRNMRQRQEGGSYRYRERWTGPGIVILHEGSTVWVVLRGRLFKCNPGHVRLATNPESLGAELLNLPELEALYGNIRGSGGPHVDMTGAPLLPEDDSTAEEGDDSATSATTATALLPVAISESQGHAEVNADIDGNRIRVLDDTEQGAASSNGGDAEMTASTSLGESNLVPTAGTTLADSNFDLSSAEGTRGLLALRESLSVEQRQAMARDDVPECVVPASLRRRLSGPVPYVEQSKTIAAEGDEPLPALIAEGEEGAAPVPDHNCDTDQESDCFTVYITMADGFMAAVTLSGRSAEVGSFSNMSSQERVAFAASDGKEWDAILSAGAVWILSPKERDEVRRSHPDRIITSRMIRRWKPGDSVDAPPVAKSRWCIR